MEKNEAFEIVWKDKKCGFKNNSGAMITEFKYDKALNFRNDVAAVCINDTWGFIDCQGKEVIQLKYYTPLPFRKEFIGEPIPVKSNDKWGYINMSGTEVIPFIYDVAFFFGDENEIAPVGFLGNKWGYINKLGEVIIPIEYENVSYLGQEENLLTVKKDGMVGLLDFKGKVVAPMTYDYIGEFHEGLSMIKLNGKYGYINKFGELVISNIFEKASVFTNGAAIVKDSNSEIPYFIDSNGKKANDIENSAVFFEEDDYFPYWCRIEEETDIFDNEINDVDLEEELRIEFFRTIDEANRLGARIRASRVKNFIWEHGAKEAAVRIIRSGVNYMPSGFLKLCEINRLDLSFENTIQKDNFRRLFTEHLLNQAEERLNYFGFYL